MPGVPMKHPFTEYLVGTAKGLTVPATVVAGAAAGVDWQKWVWIATFIWLALQSLKFVWDWLIRPHIGRRRE